MQIDTITANGVVPLRPDLRHDAGLWVAIGVTTTSNLGGGTLALGYSLDSGVTFHPLEGLTALVPGNTRQVQWPAPLFLKLSGATTPSIVVHSLVAT